MVEPKLDVVGIGSPCFDLVMRVDHLPVADENVVSLGLDTDCGGVAATATYTVARLGRKAGLVGIIGMDAAGATLREKLLAVHVNIDHLIEKTGRNATSFVMVDKSGNRAIAHYPGDYPIIPAEEIRPILPYLASARWVHVDGVHFKADLAAAEALKWASGGATRFSYDMSADPSTLLGMGVKMEEIHRLISLCDLFIPCRAAATKLTGASDPERALQKLSEMMGNSPNKIAGITLGADGCILQGAGPVIKVPAFKVKVKDTTGAGDSFHGAFLHGLCEGWDLERAAKYATAVSAIVCTRRGNWSSIPDAVGVDLFLAKGA